MNIINISKENHTIPKKFIKLLKKDKNYFINLKTNLNLCYEEYSYVDTFYGFYSQINDEILSLCVSLENYKLNNKDFLNWINSLNFFEWEQFIYNILKLMIKEGIIQLGEQSDYNFDREDDLFELCYDDKIFKENGYYKKLQEELKEKETRQSTM